MKFLKQFDPENMLFIDIETANLVKELEKGTPLYDSWAYKVRYGSWTGEKYSTDEVTPEELYKTKASLFAEFSRVACISIGMIKDGKIKIRSYKDKDEQKLLYDFANATNALQAKYPKLVLAGHAITTFDNPFLMRRMLINGIELPAPFDIAHLKPWETQVIDTLTLWKGQSYYSASLINITTAFGLPSPKDEMDGSEVNEAFHSGKLDEIATYCEKDVFALANVVLKMRGDKPVELDTDKTIKVEPVGTMEKIVNTGKMTIKDQKQIKMVMDELSNDEINKKKADEILAIVTKKI